ncbi:MAG TPA: phosphatase PAP2 family protein [Mycobacterium sp.]|nr:phosphatase PAP2 family protein [Mycobacterium sp.]
MSVDTQIFQAINWFARVTPWLHTPMLVYTTYGVVLFGALLLGGWWLARRQANPGVMAAAVWAPIGMLLAVGINQPIAGAVGETRPCRALSHILVIAPCGTDSSFPSDHGVMAGAAAVGLVLVGRQVLAWVTVAAALLIAFSRVYVGAHYPQDVLAGLLLGAAVSVAGYLLVRGVLIRLIIALQATVLRPVLTSTPATAGHETVAESVPG